MDLLIPVPYGEVWAQDTGGQGTPVVLTNSDWCDSTSWDRTVDRLADEHRVIRYDRRGYRNSPAPTAQFTQLGDLAAVLDHLAVGRAVFAGHSGGGGTAIGLAIARPQQVAALILAAPGTDDYPWPPDDPYLAEFDSLFAVGDSAGLVTLGLRTWAPGDPGELARAQISSAVGAFFRQGDYPRPDPPSWPRLAEIAVPSVVVTGDLDYPMVLAGAAAIAGRIPGCRTVHLQGVDHLLPLRAPDVLADLIKCAA